MRAYDSITVRGWRKYGVVMDRDMLVSEELSVSLDGPTHLNHYWKKVMRRLSNCLYVLVTMSTGAEKTFRRLEGERWGKGTDASEADYLSRAILEFYEDSSAASEDPSDSRYSLPS
jgi:hypothetical protein